VLAADNDFLCGFRLDLELFDFLDASRLGGSGYADVKLEYSSFPVIE
jgi:hypothetical protein